MRTTIIAIVAALAGLLAGLVLSEIIGIIGYLVSGDAIGIKFLPVYLGIIFAIAAPLIDVRYRRRRVRTPQPPDQS